MTNSKLNWGLLLLGMLGAASCTRKDGGSTTMTTDAAPIACRLNALTKEERHREGELLQEHLGAVRETRELPDGYAYRFDSNDGLFRRLAELVTLEHRCCPFLTFRLEWTGDGDPWLHVTGGPGAKEFVRSTFTPSKGDPR
jgi:hypothetical protein